jgi:hypothetical protein
LTRCFGSERWTRHRAAFLIDGNQQARGGDFLQRRRERFELLRRLDIARGLLRRHIVIEQHDPADVPRTNIFDNRIVVQINAAKANEQHLTDFEIETRRCRWRSRRGRCGLSRRCEHRVASSQQNERGNSLSTKCNTAKVARQTPGFFKKPGVLLASQSEFCATAKIF